jgi:diguanylate cyclase (GGDEF)-like protein
MEQISPDNWALMHFGLIFSITCAQMLVVYVLADSSKPPAGLGLYTVYFMASLLGWIALTLQQSAGMLMAVDIPSVITILNSYILFMAAGQRAGLIRGRLILGSACLGACLSVFFLSARQMFVVQAGFAALFFAGAGLICAWRSWRYSNIGDGIIASGGGLMAVGMPTAIYYVIGAADQPRAQAIVFGVHSAAYALVAIGFLASVLIEYQQHLSHLATEDPLTRLLNRRGLADALQISMAHASRHRLPTSAILVDIDHFKQVNDSFGHDVGDHVIRQVAEMISHMCRASDVVARTGGEEFLLVLPDTTLDSARILAERIRENVAESPLSVDSQQINVTISLGVSCISGEIDLDELSREADQALYLAKHGGRNRVASVEHRSVQLSAHTGQSTGG